MPSTRVTDLWVGPTPPPEEGPGTFWIKTTAEGKPVDFVAHNDDIAEWGR